MNKKLVFVGILLLAGLMLSACVWYEGYGYGYGHGYGYGYSHDRHDSHGYPPFRYHHYPSGGGGHHPGPGHRSHYWR